MAKKDIGILYEKFISLSLFSTAIVSSYSTKRKSIPSYFVWYKLTIVFLISISLVCSSFYPLPLAFSDTDASTTNGPFITRWGGIYGPREGEMRSPSGIALDQEGNVYVADTGNNRIQVFSSNGTYIREWGGIYGEREMFPEGIALDQEGN